MDTIEELYKSYFYPAEAKLFQIVQGQNLPYTRDDIHKFIVSQKVEQTHKQQKRKNRGYITAFSPNSEYQADILDMSKDGKQNYGFKYILMAIDIFTRKAYCVPTRDKEAITVGDAMATILKEAVPKVIMTDEGSEFIAGVFQDLLQKHNIIHETALVGDHHALGIINRFSKTLKEKIHKYQDDKDTKKYIDVLPDIIRAYNMTPHSGILDIAPNDAKKEQVVLSMYNLRKLDEGKKDIDIKTGDKVRIRLKSGVFKRGYIRNFSAEVYTVEEVQGGKVKVNDTWYVVSDVLVVPPNSVNTPIENIENTEKKQKIEKILKKEDIGTVWSGKKTVNLANLPKQRRKLLRKKKNDTTS